MSLLNADLTQYLSIDTNHMEWEASPAAGVERKRLEVLSEETEMVTTIVRFAPDSYFPAHTHGGGEEYLVLDGTFSDESGDYSAGFYVRNPPGSRHQPFTRDGCTILVKLCQFSDGDQGQINVDTRTAEWLTGPIPERSYLPLHEHDGVKTLLLRLAPNTQFPRHEHPGGEELLVLEGAFSDDRGTYTAGTWARNPIGSGHAPVTGEEGALMYLRTGYLALSHSA
ncbi:MAG: cupin domain-containing protein [Thiolinea sp.]